MVLEKLGNVVIYIGLNSWKHFKLYDGHNYLMCHKLPIPDFLAPWDALWGWWVDWYQVPTKAG